MHLNSSTVLIAKSVRQENVQRTSPFKQSRQIASSHSRVSLPQPSKEQRAVKIAARVTVSASGQPMPSFQHDQENKLGKLSLKPLANLDPSGGNQQPRFRKYHELSEGESDSEDPQVLYRALREDEDPAQGLRAPYGYDASISGQAHVAAGLRAKRKSRFVSASRSIKPPAAWQREGGLVVKFRRPSNGKVYDLTRFEDRQKIFDNPEGRIANFAKASQEVIFTGVVPPEDIIKVYKVVEEPHARNFRGIRLNPYMKAVRTRRKAGEEPRRLVLLGQKIKPVDGAHAVSPAPTITGASRHAALPGKAQSRS